MKFDSIETEEEYMKLYSEFGYFHINYGYNHTITMEDVEHAREILEDFDNFFDK